MVLLAWGLAALLSSVPMKASAPIPDAARGSALYPPCKSSLVASCRIVAPGQLRLRGGVSAALIFVAIRKAAKNLPPSIIAKLAPLCVDLHDNVDAIEAGLNQWDKILSKRALRPEESV